MRFADRIEVEMSDFFKAVDRMKPAYDAVYKFVLFLCKILLIGDIAITTMSVAGRYISFIPDPAWSEEIVLTFMAYMAVLSAALAITAFDTYLPKKVVRFLDILSDVAVLILAIVMIVVGWSYATKIGGKGTYVSMPGLSKFWQYFPVPLAGVAMVIFELESLYNHFKALCLNEDAQEVKA